MLCAGPGAFDFKQGDQNGTLFWKVVRHFLKEPSAEQVACQAPKPIILDTGSVHVPYEWCSPSSVEHSGPAHTSNVVDIISQDAYPAFVRRVDLTEQVRCCLWAETS